MKINFAVYNAPRYLTRFDHLAPPPLVHHNEILLRSKKLCLAWKNSVVRDKSTTQVSTQYFEHICKTHTVEQQLSYTVSGKFKVHASPFDVVLDMLTKWQPTLRFGWLIPKFVDDYRYTEVPYKVTFNPVIVVNAEEFATHLNMEYREDDY